MSFRNAKIRLKSFSIEICWRENVESGITSELTWNYSQLGLIRGGEIDSKISRTFALGPC